MEGRNPVEVPIGVERYWIVVQNTTHVLYLQSFGFNDKLVPLATGLTVVRTNTAVASFTQLRL